MRGCRVVSVMALACVLATSAGATANDLATNQASGTITGIVTTKAARPAPLRVTFDQKICGNSLPDASVAVNDAGQLANVVVTVTGVKAPGPAREGQVVNEQCAFVPRVQVVAPGGSVKTSSRDAVLHTTTVHQDNGRQVFNLALPAPGIELARPVKEAGVLRVSCSTHQWMRGWIVVTDELSAVTGPDGRFRLPGLPAGTYEVRFWHEALSAAPQSVTVSAGGTATVVVDMK